MSEKVAYIILYVFIFVFGSCIGSFLNVVIYRLPRKISFAKGRSHCPSCGMTLHFYDMVPVFSWLFLKGKCRNCKAKISFRYPMIEFLVGILAVLCALRFEFTIRAVVDFFVLCILVCVLFIDLDTYEIPNGLNLLLIIPCIISLFLFKEIVWYERVIGFFVISLPMYLVDKFVPTAFGGGDIKLIAVCGFYLGWKVTLIAMFACILLSGVYVLYLLIAKKIKSGAHIAYGPFLSIGVALSLFYGNEMIELYFDMFTFKF